MMSKHGATEDEHAASRSERFLALLAPHRTALERYARHALHSPDDAEDVLQATLLLAFRDFGRLADAPNFRASLFAYLVYEVRNANRRRRPETLDEAAPETAGDADDLVAVLEREAAYEAVLAEPERVLAYVGDRLARALRDLSEQERSAFLLRTLAELSYAEIATAIAEPLGTVMTRLSRARAKLRRALTDSAVAQGIVGSGRPPPGKDARS